MKNKMKKALAVFMSVLMLSTSMSAWASSTDVEEEWDESIPTAASITDIKAKSAILMELSTGNILFEQNIDEPLPPASVTKIMTLLLVMEEIDKGNIKYDDIVTASEHACSMGGSQIWLEPNEQMSVDDLLKATAVNSANDASVALGELVAGSEEAFVELMNQKAQALGMTNTHFVNATGLDADGHLTTARDIAIMSRELLSHKDIIKYTTIWQGELRGGKTGLTNTNKLVRFYDGVTGLKTGTTDGAGHCLSASAERGGLGLVAVVMGAQTTPERNDLARKLLDHGFANYSVYTPTIDETIPSSIKVLRGVEDMVGIVTDITNNIVIEKNKIDAIEKKVTVSQDIAAPVSENQVVGKIEFLVDDKVIAEYSIRTTEAIDKISFFSAFAKLFQSIFI